MCVSPLSFHKEILLYRLLVSLTDWRWITQYTCFCSLFITFMVILHFFLLYQHGQSALDKSRIVFLLAWTLGVSCRLVMDHLIHVHFVCSLHPPLPSLAWYYIYICMCTCISIDKMYIFFCVCACMCVYTCIYVCVYVYVHISLFLPSACACTTIIDTSQWIFIVWYIVYQS